MLVELLDAMYIPSSSMMLHLARTGTLGAGSVPFVAVGLIPSGLMATTGMSSPQVSSPVGTSSRRA